MKSDNFESFPLVSSSAEVTKSERLAAALEQSIRLKYWHPKNWIAHRWINTFGANPLKSLGKNGQRILGAVADSDTKLRNYKVRLLADEIQRLKPRRILELGSGASTFLIAELLHKNAVDYGVFGKLISLEASSDYFRRIESAMPDELKQYVHLQKSNVSLRWFGDYRALSYDELPIGDHFDIVFIDGPASFVPGYRQPIFALSGDLIVLARAGSTFSLGLTDVRWMNARFYRDLLPSNYQVFNDIPRRTVRVVKST